MSLFELTTKLRSLINDTRKQGELLKNKSKWSMLCASLDAIQDSQSAIDAYQTEEDFNSTSKKYLFLYGLLQALVLQQDALKHIAESLDIKIELDNALLEIREVRNDSIGHPTKRDRPKNRPEAYCMITQMSLTKYHFQYLKFTPTIGENSYTSKQINLKQIIETQATLILKVLEQVCLDLENEEHQHRMKFTDQKLCKILHPQLDYYYEKISDAINHEQYSSFGKAHVVLISEAVENFRKALVDRGLWDNSDGAQYHYEQIFYPLEQLFTFFEDKNNSRLNGKDASIFNTFLRKEIEALRAIAAEIDDEYSGQSQLSSSEDAIGKFISYFNQQIELILKLESPLYKKLLFSCLLDTISHSRFPDHHNSNKFLKFVEDTCKWDCANRVSTPQLLMILKRKGLDKGQLYIRLSERIESWVSGNILNPEADPLFDELDQITVVGEKKFLNEKTYSQLFYNYRNHLIHNFREPGYGIELSDDGDRPYYHSMISIANKDDLRWQLVFPVDLFTELCRKGLKELESYFRSENINPYDLYPFGDEWKRRS